MFGQTQWHFETCSLWLLWENCWKVGIYFVCVNYSIAIWNYVVCTWSKFKNVWFHSIAQSCNLTNFSILGDFEQKMADNSDFKKTPHFICLKWNQICFTSLFCCCQVFICFKIKFLTTNVKTLITDYLMKIGFENPRFSLFSDAICSKS